MVSCLMTTNLTTNLMRNFTTNSTTNKMITTLKPTMTNTKAGWTTKKLTINLTTMTTIIPTFKPMVEILTKIQLAILPSHWDDGLPPSIKFDLIQCFWHIKAHKMCIFPWWYFISIMVFTVGGITTDKIYYKYGIAWFFYIIDINWFFHFCDQFLLRAGLLYPFFHCSVPYQIEYWVSIYFRNIISFLSLLMWNGMMEMISDGYGQYMIFFFLSFSFSSYISVIFLLFLSCNINIFILYLVS